MTDERNWISLRDAVKRIPLSMSYASPHGEREARLAKYLRDELVEARAGLCCIAHLQKRPVERDRIEDFPVTHLWWAADALGSPYGSWWRTGEATDLEISGGRFRADFYRITVDCTQLDAMLGQSAQSCQLASGERPSASNDDCAQPLGPGRPARRQEKYVEIARELKSASPSLTGAFLIRAAAAECKTQGVEPLSDAYARKILRIEGIIQEGE